MKVALEEVDFKHGLSVKLKHVPSSENPADLITR